LARDQKKGGFTLKEDVCEEVEVINHEDLKNKLEPLG